MPADWAEEMAREAHKDMSTRLYADDLDILAAALRHAHEAGVEHERARRKTDSEKAAAGVDGSLDRIVLLLGAGDDGETLWCDHNPYSEGECEVREYVSAIRHAEEVRRAKAEGMREALLLDMDVTIPDEFVDDFERVLSQMLGAIMDRADAIEKGEA